MLNAVGVTIRFGKRTLFEDVNIKFNKGCCYGIIYLKPMDTRQGISANGIWEINLFKSFIW